MPSKSYDPGGQDYEISDSMHRSLPNSVDDLNESLKRGLNYKKILSFYRQQLDRYKFTNAELEVEDVFAEAWMRTYSILLRKNRSINNWNAWFMGVGKNIILENLKKKNKQSKLNVIERNSAEDVPSELERHSDLEEEQEEDLMLQCILNSLSHDDISLLILRIQNECSWKQVSDSFPGATEAALRKRYSRLMRELKKRIIKD